MAQAAAAAAATAAAATAAPVTTCGSACEATLIPSGDPSTAANQTRHVKASVLYMKEVWEKNALADPSDYFYSTAPGGDRCWGGPGRSGVRYEAEGYVTWCHGSSDAPAEVVRTARKQEHPGSLPSNGLLPGVSE